jgi:hypothetical protein
VGCKRLPLAIFLQGDAGISPTAFGDGVRCLGGQLKRFYVENFSSDAASAQAAGEPSITTRSAALGDTIDQGSARFHQVYYRDANLSFCFDLQGSTWNLTIVLAVV